MAQLRGVNCALPRLMAWEIALKTEQQFQMGSKLYETKTCTKFKLKIKKLVHFNSSHQSRQGMIDSPYKSHIIEMQRNRWKVTFKNVDYLAVNAFQTTPSTLQEELLISVSNSGFKSLRMHTQGCQGCQKIRNLVRNSKILIARSTIQPKLSKIKNH